MNLFGVENFCGAFFRACKIPKALTQAAFEKLSNGSKNDQRILFSIPLVAFASVGEIELSEFYPKS